MRDTLILMTGVLRFDNLKTIAKVINKYYDTWNELYDIYWLICKDQYNGFGDLDSVVNYLKTTNIKYEIINTGKPNQPNYGGDLFNEPLEQFITSHNLDNPWIYVLDDDNIPHANLFGTFYLYTLFCKSVVNKDILLLNILFGPGYTKIISSTLLNSYNEKYNFTDGMCCADPSSVIMRYSIIKKHGMFAPGTDYDYSWLYFVMDKEKDNICYWNYLSRGDVPAAYHNHALPIIDTKNIDEYSNINKNDINIDINLSKILTNDDIYELNYMTRKEPMPVNIPILSDESKQKIIDIIYSEIQHIKEKDEI